MAPPPPLFLLRRDITSEETPAHPRTLSGGAPAAATAPAAASFPSAATASVPGGVWGGGR